MRAMEKELDTEVFLGDRFIQKDDVLACLSSKEDDVVWSVLVER